MENKEKNRKKEPKALQGIEPAASLGGDWPRKAEARA